MTKYTTILEGPALNRSGYGEMTDSIFECLHSYLKCDTSINVTGWGACPNRSSTEPRDRLIESKIIRGQKEVPQPDIYFAVTIPHLSHAPVGKKMDINFSAGIEVDFVYDNVIDGLNKHSLNIVCSEFARTVYENSPKKVTSPIEVVSWSANTAVYKMTKETLPTVDKMMEEVDEKEAFLFVGQITHNNIFSDRKDVGNLCKTFYETFWQEEVMPALILKTSGISFSTMDRNHCMERIQQLKNAMAAELKVDVKELPSIYVLHGELTEIEMNALYNHNKVIAHISFSHGEGFGMPLLQSSLSGKPVIAPNYSGHLDFLPKERAILLDGELKEIHPSIVSEYFPPKSKWFVVDYKKAMTVLMNFYKNDRTLHNTLATLLAKENSEKFNMEKMKYRLHKVLDKYIK
jgi:glycosyltransferase involved in cell wall biosynthesis